MFNARYRASTERVGFFCLDYKRNMKGVPLGDKFRVAENRN
jgi:hypothetical protein